MKKIIFLFLVIFSFKIYAKTYIVAIDPAFPPFSVYDYEKRVGMGLDVDILQEIARREGFDIDVVGMDWSKWAEILANNEADIWAGGIAILDARRDRALYSESYMPYGTGVFTLNKGESLQITADNLKDYRLSAPNSTVDLEYIRDIHQNTPEKAKGVGTNYLGIKDVAMQNTDGLVSNYAVLSYYANRLGKDYRVFLLGDFSDPNKRLGFMVKPNNHDLLIKINNGINSMRADGTLQALEKKWLGHHLD